MAFTLSIDDVDPDIISDIGAEFFVDSFSDEKGPPIKRQRVTDSEFKEWMTVGSVTHTTAKLTTLNGKIFFEVSKHFIPVINPFLEYYVGYDGEFPPTIIQIHDIKITSRITKEKWNKFSYKENVRSRKRDWTPRESLKQGDVIHSELFGILTRERAYFQILNIYGPKFANLLTDTRCSDLLRTKNTDKFFFPFQFKFVPDSVKFTRPMTLPDHLIGKWDNIEKALSIYRDTGVFCFETNPVLKECGFTDDENKLIMARGAEKVLRDNIDLFKEVRIMKSEMMEGVSPLTDPLTNFSSSIDEIVIRDAEHVSDAQWINICKLKRPIICYGDPDFTVVDPFFMHHFNGFKFICSIMDVVEHEWEKSWHKYVHSAFINRRLGSILQAKTDFFRYIPDVQDWKTIQKQIGINGAPPGNTLVICGSESIYHEAQLFMMPPSSDKRVQTFDYKSLKLGDKVVNTTTRLLNFTTFTGCFSDPRDDVVMIIGADTPRTLMAAVTKLARKRITLYWSPGTPSQRRIL